MPLTVHPVASLSEPGLHPYRTMRQPAGHREQGIFVAEGSEVVRRLLESPLEVRSVLATSRWVERLSPLLERPDRAATTVFAADDALLRDIVGFRFHQGVMAVGRIPPEPALAGLPDGHLVVALDGLAHAENVGVVVRNAAGLGAHAVLVGGTTCSPWVRRAVRNSMGAVFTIPALHADHLQATIAGLKTARHTRVVAADPAGPGRLGRCVLRGNVCVVFGSERVGISPGVRELADELVAIPMHGGTDSLNVGCASAIFLYEARRQRSA